MCASPSTWSETGRTPKRSFRTRSCARIGPSRGMKNGSVLGRGVARALADRGDRVTVLQRHPAGLGLQEALTDISDADAVLDAIDGHEAVIHLAAKVNVVGPEAEYQRVNVQGTRAVVDACVTAGA